MIAAVLPANAAASAPTVNLAASMVTLKAFSGSAAA